MTAPAAIVVGLDTIVGLQTARVLHARGVPVIGIASDADHYCARTRRVDRCVEAPTAGDGLVEALARLSDELDEPPVLFPCRDPSVHTVSEHRADLAARVLLPDHDTLVRLSDKAAFEELARELDVRTPRTVAVTRDDTVADVAGHLAFPVILKPTFRDDRWQHSGNEKAYVAHSTDELTDVHRSAGTSADEFVVQEWIPGPPTAQFTCNALFGTDGSPRATFVSRKIRQWPRNTGVGSMGVGVHDTEVEELTVGLFRAVGFRGLAYLEVKRDPRDGRLVVIEPNVGRPTGRSALADHCGVDLLLGCYREAIGRPLTEVGRQPPRGPTWTHLRADLQAGLAAWRDGETTLGAWLASYRPPLRDAVWSFSDPRPLAADVARSSRIMVAALRQRSRR